MGRDFKIRKLIRGIIREEIMSSAKFYLHASPSTHFPYEEGKEEDDLEAQSEVMKMTTDMGFEPSKGYIATTYVN
jgi:hypothetical protein